MTLNIDMGIVKTNVICHTKKEKNLVGIIFLFFIQEEHNILTLELIDRG